MSPYTYIIFGISITMATGYPKNSYKSSREFPFVTREEWGAKPSGGEVSHLNSPVPYVVIHHSFDPPACQDKTECVKSMQYIQDMHQIDNGWQDIGYNFGVGGDGAVYEGRGWETVGAHAVGFNIQSIGIVLIGDWVSTLPPQKQLDVTKELIAYGVSQGYIHKDYQLIGHRQVGVTECPGNALYAEISSWKSYVPVIKKL